MKQVKLGEVSGEGRQRALIGCALTLCCQSLSEEESLTFTLESAPHGCFPDTGQKSFLSEKMCVCIGGDMHPFHIKQELENPLMHICYIKALLCGGCQWWQVKISLSFYILYFLMIRSDLPKVFFKAKYVKYAWIILAKIINTGFLVFLVIVQ